jgi:hypothetical protein
MMLAALALLWTASNAVADALALPAADFTILSAAGGSVIGSVHYDVKHERPGVETVTSSARYRSGEYDVERDAIVESGGVELPGGAGVPSMSAYAHDFYRADGSRFLSTKADFRSGEAVCTKYDGGEPTVQRATLQFPPDVYAGAAMILPLQHAIQTGASGPITMHDFVCIPGPKLLKVEAYTQDAAPWPHYPGALIRADIKPDFGWLSYVIAPFVPEMHAWFARADSFSFVGAQFSRFYKGPEIILARAPVRTSALPAKTSARLSAAKP